MANDKVISTAALIEKFQYALDNGWGYIWGTDGELWTEKKQNAATRQQTIEYGRKWIGHYVADCSGLFSWAFKQLGGYMYHGSNTMYKSYCTAKGKLSKGKRTDGQELKPGTAVFTGTENKHGHVGLYIGNGWVIEAQGTKNGVIKSKVTLAKWTFWGELKGVDYQNAEPVPEKLPTLRKGDKGPYVTLAQTNLKQRGYDLGPCGVDGDFGTATEKAVKKFQRDWNLTVDGIIGPVTWQYLLSVPVKDADLKYTVTITGLDLTQAKALINNYPGSTMKEE